MSNRIVQTQNKKLNGFMMFVLNFKKNLHENNHDINDIKKIIDLAAPHWEQLSEEEKDEYRQKAQFSDATIEFPSKRKRKKLNCFGDDIDEIDAHKEAENKKYIEMVEDIRSLITKANDLGELDDLVFYFINTSTFYENVDIYPAEIAIAKFTLKAGVFDFMQIRINPGELPVGSGFEAEEKSKKTHKYPLPPVCGGETNYMTMLETIIKFLHPMKKLPIFFAEGNTRDDKTTLNETSRTINKIFYESQEDDMLDDIKIYPIEELFFMLHRMIVIVKNRRNGTNDGQFPSVVSAAETFKNDSFAHVTQGCEFHNNCETAKFCCLSKVRRFGYNIAKWCSDPAKYPLIAGQHFPLQFEPTE